MLFPYLLQRMVHQGTLQLVTACGKNYTIGEGAPQVRIKLHRKSLEWTLALWPDLKIGEAYMDDLLTIEEGSLRDFLHILMVNYRKAENQPIFQWLKRLSGRTLSLRQFNPRGRARKNVAYHYDLPDQLYDLFLDSDRQYSCAYFTDPDNDLEQAQLDKKRHIASKLFLNRRGLKLLDIGSGWGGLGLYLAREGKCDVTGVTLSVRQYKISQRRAKKARLDKACHFKLRDYRQEIGTYDRIVSVGMFEHVGKKNYDEFFSCIHRLLSDDGVCLIHTISRFNEPESVGPFINKHVFPGTDVPALSEVMESVQRSGLYVTDIEILRLHYANTLYIWSQRVFAHKDEIISLYGSRFYRGWQFYLNSCELSFRYRYLMVAQIQLSKQLETLPLTRDYMYEWEERCQDTTAYNTKIEAS